MSEISSATRLKRAFSIGIVCIFSYLVSYYSRNLLSVSSPAMVESGLYTKDFLGLLSSVYMITYAAGQLVNGIMGDILNPKRMVGAGLLGTGLISILFPFLPRGIFQVICFALFGFALSMLRGPLVKIISENTSKNHSRTICTFFSVASFAGPFVASLLSIVFPWKSVFVVAGCLTAVICIAAFSVLSVFERKGYISYTSGKNQGLKGVLQVFKIERFIFYMVVGAVIETAITAVSFWVPTYLTEQLGFPAELGNSIYAVIFFFKGLMPFLSLALFRLSKENDVLLMRIFFGLATVFYLGVAFVPHPWVNVVLLAFALMSVGCAGALLWSIYIPGMGKTGKVSSINGILDCSGYIVAAVCNAVFGLVAQYLSWTGVVLLWAGIVAVGLIAAFTQRKGKTDGE